MISAQQFTASHHEDIVAAISDALSRAHQSGQPARVRVPIMVAWSDRDLWQAVSTATEAGWRVTHRSDPINGDYLEVASPDLATPEPAVVDAAKAEALADAITELLKFRKGIEYATAEEQAALRKVKSLLAEMGW